MNGAVHAAILVEVVFLLGCRALCRCGMYLHILDFSNRTEQRVRAVFVSEVLL